MQTVVQGLLANFESVGSGRRALVVLHGWGGSLDEWRFMAEEWSDRYRVVLVDLPGFGGSQRPGGVWGVNEYAVWVEEFLIKLKIRDMVMVGHSFGGRMGLILGTRLKSLRKLVLIDAAGMEIKTLKTKLLAWLAPFFKWLPDSARRVFRARDYKDSGEMKEIYKRVVNENLRGVLNEVKVESLIIWGEKDSVLAFEEAKMLREGIGGAKLRVVWGGDHWPHIKKRNDLVKILKEEGI
jgi:pimeloyl-ACP methyl ester carboxylesterase